VTAVGHHTRTLSVSRRPPGSVETGSVVRREAHLGGGRLNSQDTRTPRRTKRAIRCFGWPLRSAFLGVDGSGAHARLQVTDVSRGDEPIGARGRVEADQSPNPTRQIPTSVRAWPRCEGAAVTTFRRRWSHLLVPPSSHSRPHGPRFRRATPPTLRGADGEGRRGCTLRWH